MGETYRAAIPGGWTERSGHRLTERSRWKLTRSRCQLTEPTGQKLTRSRPRSDIKTRAAGPRTTARDPRQFSRVPRISGQKPRFSRQKTSPKRPARGLRTEG